MALLLYVNLVPGVGDGRALEYYDDSNDKPPEEA